MALKIYKVYKTLEQYFVDNGEATGETKPNTVGDPDFIPRAEDAVACPVTKDTSPKSLVDLTTVECKFMAPRKSSATVAKFTDGNADSPTFGQYFKLDGTFTNVKADGGYFTYSSDAIACPVESTDPIPLPVMETLKCKYNPPRATPEQVVQKYDSNENSPTIGQRLKEDGTYTNNHEEAAWFVYSTDPTACPLSVTVSYQVWQYYEENVQITYIDGQGCSIENSMVNQGTVFGEYIVLDPSKPTQYKKVSFINNKWTYNPSQTDIIYSDDPEVNQEATDNCGFVIYQRRLVLLGTYNVEIQ